MHRVAAGECRGRGPQRIIRCGDEDLVAVVDERLRDHRDQLGDAVAEEDVVDRQVREVRLQLVARVDRAPGRQDALGLGIALRVGERGDHIPHNDVGRLETKDSRIPRVEFENAVALLFELRGPRRHRSTDLVQDVLEFRRLVQRPQHVTAERAVFRAIRCHTHQFCHLPLTSGIVSGGDYVRSATSLPILVCPRTQDMTFVDSIASLIFWVLPSNNLRRARPRKRIGTTKRHRSPSSIHMSAR